MTTVPIPYSEVIAGPELPTRFTDTALVADYRASGSPAGELIYLGFGEAWSDTAPGLVAALGELPGHAHGYVISQYGLPRLQRVLGEYLTHSHCLPPEARLGRDYQVAVSHGGTRNAMFDFGRLLLADASPGQPLVIAPMPGWDYAGVFTGLGYRTRFLPIRQQLDHQPDPAELAGLLAGRDRGRPTLVVINAQHNPTGTNWAPDSVRALIRLALEQDAAVLLDDAYFGVHDPALRPTSALRVLLEELLQVAPARRRRWLAVRSLGKQFRCNGWGIGAATAHPETLGRLVNDVQFQRGFASAVPLQQAMASWLADPAAQHYLDAAGREYTEKRTQVRDLLTRRLSYPPEGFQLGEFAPYARITLPAGHRSVAEFQRECLAKSGVLVGVDRWSTDNDAHEERPCFRLFLGAPLAAVREALARMAEAGYRHR